MGMDFTAYLSHKLREEDLTKLVKDLNENIKRFPFINNFIEDLLEYNPEDKEKKWRHIPDSIGGTIDIVGPCGITLTFSETVCYFHHYIRWRNFLLDRDIQLKLREVCYELMQTMNSLFVIYVPDNAVKESAIIDFLWEDENKDIFFMREWLLNKCGPPKKSIKDIYIKHEDYWESDGYFIDEFKDF